MFELSCVSCGTNAGDMNLLNGELFCCKCGKAGKHNIAISEKSLDKLKTFPDNNEFRKIEFGRDDELSILSIFNSHVEKIRGKDGVLKSYGVFMSAI
jgi:hypothetical protein